MISHTCLIFGVWKRSLSADADPADNAGPSIALASTVAPSSARRRRGRPVLARLPADAGDGVVMATQSGSTAHTVVRTQFERNMNSAPGPMPDIRALNWENADESDICFASRKAWLHYPSPGPATPPQPGSPTAMRTNTARRDLHALAASAPHASRPCEAAREGL